MKNRTVQDFDSFAIPSENSDEVGGMLELPTPGKILKSEFMNPMAITPYRLAKDIGVDQGRVEDILDGKRAITTDTAMRLARYFGTTAGFWLNLQTSCDLRRAERDAESGVYDRITIHPAAAKALVAA